jgi:hypothetical protein
MRWTRVARLTSVPACGRRSRVVLTPRRWCQVGDDAMAMSVLRPDTPASRRRRWQTSPVTGESAKEPVKTIAQGMPDASGEPVVTNARAFYPPRAAAGATGARHSLCPLFFRGRKFQHNSGAARRGKSDARSSVVMPPLQAGHPVRRDVSYAHEPSLYTGSPGHRRAGATPSFGRLCRATTPE